MDKTTRGVLWDIGSVLCISRWDNLAFRLQEHAHHSHWKGASWDQVRIALMQSRIIHEFDDGKFTALQFYRKILAFFNVDPSDLSYREFRALWGNATELNKPLIDLLWEIRRTKNIPMAIASNTQELHWEFFVKNYYDAFLKAMDTFVLSYSIGASKPDPQFYHECSLRLGLEMPNLVFVDDREENGLPFERMGGTFVKYDMNSHDVAEKEIRRLLRMDAMPLLR